jgi:hypothetical protein
MRGTRVILLLTDYHSFAATRRFLQSLKRASGVTRLLWAGRL